MSDAGSVPFPDHASRGREITEAGAATSSDRGVRATADLAVANIAGGVRACLRAATAVPVLGGLVRGGARALTRGGDALLTDWVIPRVIGTRMLLATVVTAIVEQLDLTEFLADNLDLNRLVELIDLDVLVHRIDLEPVLARIDLDALAERVDIDALVERLDVGHVVDRLDIDHVVARLDIDGVVARLDIRAVVARLDIDAIVERLDLESVVGRLDLDGTLTRVDIDALVGRIDLTDLVGDLDLPALIRNSTADVTTEFRDRAREMRSRAFDRNR